MTIASVLADSGKIFIQFIWDVLYFPLWWYSFGFFGTLKWTGRFIARHLRTTGVLIWVANLFTPMYGQHDWAGMIISFFVRLIQIIVRTIIFGFWVIIALAGLLLWLIAPIFILYELARQLGFFIS